MEALFEGVLHDVTRVLSDDGILFDPEVSSRSRYPREPRHSVSGDRIGWECGTGNLCTIGFTVK